MTPTPSRPLTRPAICAVLALCAAPLAGAQELAEAPAAEPAVVWSCWYNGKLHVLCRVTAAPDEPAAPDGAAEPAADTSPSAYPRYGPLPVTVQTIRDHPAQLRDRTIAIPLFSPPLDRLRVEQLADSVMCGGVASCRVDHLHADSDFGIRDGTGAPID